MSDVKPLNDLTPMAGSANWEIAQLRSQLATVTAERDEYRESLLALRTCEECKIRYDRASGAECLCRLKRRRAAQDELIAERDSWRRVAERLESENSANCMKVLVDDKRHDELLKAEAERDELIACLRPFAGKCKCTDPKCRYRQAAELVARFPADAMIAAEQSESHAKVAGK